MKLYHATLKSNLDSIRAEGLDPMKAKGKIKGVWLHTASKRAWAVLHTMKRHNVHADEIVVIEVEIPRSKLTRRWRGLWTCEERITEFTQVVGADVIAESPIEYEVE